MVLLQLENVSLSVESQQLLDGVSAQIVESQRVALVGRNGSGKSTLLRALASNADDYFVVGAGSIERKGNALLVEQDNLRWSRLIPECDEEELREMTVEEALDASAAEGSEVALDDLDSWRRLRVTTTRDTPIGLLSPGSAMKAYLGIALNRTDIDLLLLDEPTNHLDMPSIIWLQETILERRKAIVVVSHDVAFVEAVADHVWDIDSDKKELRVSGASYSAYRRAKEVAREQQRVAYEAQQDRHRRLTAVATKLRAASAAGERFKAKDHDTLQRDFKRDRAGRSGKKAKAVESLRDKNDTVERVVDRRPLHIELDSVEISGDSSIMLGTAKIGYDDDTALPIAPLTVRIDYGERVAIVGLNGVGKSTVLRTITGQLSLIEGSVHVGRELRIGNLTQEHETLPRLETPREYMAKTGSLHPFDAGAGLFSYGLTRAQIDTPISKLNPGARARLLLASFSMRKVNALILDEPTNHLDEEAITEIVATLNSYKGTVVVVSHSRQFLASLDLTRILQLTPQDGFVELDSIEEFRTL